MTTVPLLGFEGEHHLTNKGILIVPLPEDFIPYEQADGWRGSRIEVYRWTKTSRGENPEGYNLFLPGMPPCSVGTPLEAKLIIHEYLQR